MPVRSTKLRNHARNQPCTLRFDCCDGGGETTVLAHIRDGHKGMGIKASDLSACYACGPCHARLDFEPHKIEPVDFYRSQLRAMQETQERLYLDGLIIVPVDPTKPAHDRPIKPRKPSADRTKIPGRGFGPGRKMQSRNTLRKEPT